MFDETGRRREIAGLDRAHPRHQRQRQARRVGRAQPAGRPDKGQAHRAVFYAVMPNPADGSIWGTVRRRPRRDRAPRPGLQPAGDGAGGNLQRPEARLRRARRRHRSQRRGVGLARRAATSAASTVASARVRSTGRKRPAITARKAGALSVSRPRLRGHRREQRRVELLHVGRSARHVRAGRERADRRPATSSTVSSRWWTANGRRCACPTRWASTPRDSTGASTIPAPDGKAAAYGSSGDRTPWLNEGGKGTKPLVVHFQIRPTRSPGDRAADSVPPPSRHGRQRNSLLPG